MWLSRASEERLHRAVYPDKPVCAGWSQFSCCFPVPSSQHPSVWSGEWEGLGLQLGGDVCSLTGLDSLWIWPVWALCSFEGRGTASGSPLDVLEKDQQVLIYLLHTKGLQIEIGGVVIPFPNLYERGAIIQSNLTSLMARGVCTTLPCATMGFSFSQFTLMKSLQCVRSCAIEG